MLKSIILRIQFGYKNNILNKFVLDKINNTKHIK